jgi:hypothetical protein
MTTSIITPTNKMTVSHRTGKGVHHYEQEELWSPGTDLWKSCVLDIGSPASAPNKTYAFDRSRYHNDGTISGAVWKQQPNGLWAPVLDGTDDKIVIPNSPLLDFERTDAFTFEFWFNPAPYDGDPDALYCTLNEAVGGVGIRSLCADGTVDFRLTDNHTVSDIAITMPLTANIPVMITITYDGSSNPAGMTGYINGSFFSFGGGQVLTGSTVTGRPHYIGCSADAGRFLEATIAIIHVYKDELTASEVRQSFNVASWRM